MKEDKKDGNAQGKQNPERAQVDEEIFRMVYFLSRIKKLKTSQNQAK